MARQHQPALFTGINKGPPRLGSSPGVWPPERAGRHDLCNTVTRSGDSGVQERSEGCSGSGVVSGRRLLPWCREDGQPCYLLADDANSGFVSRLADGLESVQIGMSADLLDYVDVASPDASASELIGLIDRLRQALRDVSRVAGSRSARLGVRSEALQLVIAAKQLGVTGKPAPDAPIADLRHFVEMLREALSGVVDLAEVYGERLPQQVTDEAALHAMEVINREISYRRSERESSTPAQREAAGNAVAAPLDRKVTEGGS